jgi:hypothetical protein
LADQEAVARWAGQPQPGVLIISKEAWAEVERRNDSLGLTEIASKRGLNYSKGKTLEVAALLRRGTSE